MALCFKCASPDHKSTLCTLSTANTAGKEAYDTYVSSKSTLRGSRTGSLNQDKPPRAPLTSHERVMSMLEAKPSHPISHIYAQSSSLHLPSMKQRNCKVLKAFRSHYRTFFNKKVSECYKALPGTRPSTESPWRSALNTAVKLGKPADFSTGCDIYALERLVPRCRSFYNLLLAPTPMMSSVRASLDGPAALTVASIGSGPGQDLVVLNAYKGYCTALGYGSARLTTTLFDLYSDQWEPVAAATRAACAVEDSICGPVEPCDLRLGSCSPENAGVPVSTAGLFVFAYVLHENASYLATGGGLKEGTLLWDVLLKAKVGAHVVAADSEDRLWCAVAEAAAQLGWEVEGRTEVR